MADEVGGDDVFSSVVKDALVFTLRSLLDDSLDFIVCGRLLDADNKVDNRDIESGNTESETPVDKRSE